MITRIVLFSLFSLTISSCDLSGMDKNSINITIEIDSPQITYPVEHQGNEWACGYRSVFNAWLVKKNNFSFENLDLKNPTPSFESWIQLMKKKWDNIFDSKRPFMNGKYDNEGENTLDSWKNTSNQQCLDSKDVELLALLTLDDSEEAEENIKHYIEFHEKKTRETDPWILPHVSVIESENYTLNSWPTYKPLQHNIARFQHEKEIQIIFLHENFHWTTLILLPEKECYILDSLNSKNRSINQVAYNMFVLTPFPTTENLSIFFSECKKIRRMKNKNTLEYTTKIKNLFEWGLKNGIIKNYINAIFKKYCFDINQKPFNTSEQNTVIDVVLDKNENKKIIIDLVSEEDEQTLDLVPNKKIEKNKQKSCCTIL